MKYRRTNNNKGSQLLLSNLMTDGWMDAFHTYVVVRSNFFYYVTNYMNVENYESFSPKK